MATTDLYPTRTRRQLLADVAAGKVYRAESGYVMVRISSSQGQNRRVDAQIREVETAGWVEQLGDGWRLTDAGRTVLEAGTR